MNLGVHFEQVDLLTGQQRRGSLCAEDAILNVRIGTLTEKRSDRWWQIGDVSQAKETADSAAQAWNAYASPWFTQCENVDGAQRFAAERELMGPAFLLALVAGDRTEAERWLGVITASSGGMEKEMYHRIAANQGMLT